MDDLDIRLYEELRHDGRASMVKLARATGLSRAGVRSRVSRLINEGQLRVTGIVHPSSQGFSALAHLTISVRGSARDVAVALAAIEDVTLVSIVAGPSALIAEVNAPGIIELDLTIRRVSLIAGVVDINTSIYTARIKDLYEPTGPIEAKGIDDIDRRIVAVLETDGRASFAEIARSTNLSQSTVRSRIHQMTSRRVLQISAVAIPDALGLQYMCGFGLVLEPGTENATLFEIEKIRSVSYLSRTLGRWNAIGTLLAESQHDVAHQLDSIRLVTGVCNLSSWTHLEVVKENYQYSTFKTSPFPSRAFNNPLGKHEPRIDLD